MSLLGSQLSWQTWPCWPLVWLCCPWIRPTAIYGTKHSSDMPMSSLLLQAPFFRLTKWFTSSYRSESHYCISPYHPLSGIGRTYSFLPLESLSDLLNGFLMGDSQISGTWTHSDCKLLINSLVSWPSITGLQCFRASQVMSATDNTTVVFPQTGWDPFPCPIMSSCCFYSMASILPVTVGQPITTEWSLHPEIVSRLFRTWDTPTMDILASVHNTHLS